MKDVLYAIGEALIDFAPAQSGCPFDEVTAFMPMIGGAPANVCAAFAKLGGKSSMITQLGDDPFGHKIADELAVCGVSVEHISFTDHANTALAFVSLDADGNRTFSFYRNPSADMLLSEDTIISDWFTDAFALHFCSVSLVESPMKRSHVKAIASARKHGAIISFDPNLRFNLWKNKNQLKQTVLDFIPQCDILKISDEELAFITGKTNIRDALPLLFNGSVKLVLYTCGKDGAHAFTKSSSAAYSPAADVIPVDTTGAGDAFIGAFLRKLCDDGIQAENLADLGKDKLVEYLDFANQYCGRSILKKGAIPSYPHRNEL